jgi:RNA polymerase sigma-70 factor (ECF subfamily)
MSADRLVELYRAYGGAIYARCRRMLLDAEAAEDATQETFIRVHRHLLHAPDHAEALRWIYRIASNYCLNVLRDRRLAPVAVATVPELTDATVPDHLADRDAVRRLAAQIPRKLAAVAWLYHVDGLDQAEVAQVLGISRRTVVNRLGEFQDRARKILAPSQ